MRPSVAPARLGRIRASQQGPDADYARVFWAVYMDQAKKLAAAEGDDVSPPNADTRQEEVSNG